jgi:hypothetical protein
MERETGIEIDLHQVRRVVEVRVHAANELLDSGWILHEIFFGNDCDYRPYYILLGLDDIVCPKCGAPANIEVLDEGDRVRYICTKECS